MSGKIFIPLFAVLLVGVCGFERDTNVFEMKLPKWSFDAISVPSSILTMLGEPTNCFELAIE